MAEIYQKLDKIEDAIESRTFSIDVPEYRGRQTIIPKQLFVLGIRCLIADNTYRTSYVVINLIHIYFNFNLISLYLTLTIG